MKLNTKFKQKNSNAIQTTEFKQNSSNEIQMELKTKIKQNSSYKIENKIYQTKLKIKFKQN
jgi:hypothetical protein